MTALPPRGGEAVPQGEAPPEATGLGAPASAGLARRLAALLYEAMIAAAIVLVAGFALAPLISLGPASGGPALGVPGPAALVFQFCALFAVLAAYFVGCWSGGRRTLPMKTWHLALVTRSGDPLTGRVALARYLAGWLGPALATLAYALSQSRWSALFALANYVWAWVDRDGVFLHDRIAGSRLIERR